MRCGKGPIPMSFRCITTSSSRGKSRAGAKNGDCHQFARSHDPRNEALSLKRIGWLYPIFRHSVRIGLKKVARWGPMACDQAERSL